MTQSIVIAEIHEINHDLLDWQLKEAAPQDCYGVSTYGEQVSIVVSDTIAPALLNTLRNICLAHDPTAKTPAQQAEDVRKEDIENFLQMVYEEIDMKLLIKVVKHLLIDHQ